MSSHIESISSRRILSKDLSQRYQSWHVFNFDNSIIVFTSYLERSGRSSQTRRWIRSSRAVAFPLMHSFAFPMSSLQPSHQSHQSCPPQIHTFLKGGLVAWFSVLEGWAQYQSQSSSRCAHEHKVYPSSALLPAKSRWNFISSIA